MFRTAELKRRISKEDFHDAVPSMRAGLLDVQQRLRQAPFPVILVFGGVDKGGKTETINIINEWMDPRWVVTRAYGAPSDEMAERPEYWRYWRDLPPRGRIGVFLSCWYSRPLLDRVYGHSEEADFDEALEQAAAFERCLADDGALILKFWMHLGRDAQEERLRKLEKNPLTRWRVTATDWDHWHMYDRFIAAAERLIMRTSTGNAPWHVVEGYDKRYRSLTVGQMLLDAIERHLTEREVHQKIACELKARNESVVAEGEGSESVCPTTGAKIIRLSRVSVLSCLPTDRMLEKKAYETALEKRQGELNSLCRRAKELGMSTILVFEGWDAAGKGGAIRRVTAALDARDFQVIPIAAPNDEERAHHYLWRFWRHLSRAGRVTIFDRSWYGRVLVERVEHFASAAEWSRAFAEINEFEEQLIQHGIVLCKFWLHITQEEQLNRFREREDVTYKRWKLTDEDWRNREKWDHYEEAVDDMVERTSTALAPWTLVEAGDKRYARIKVLETVCQRLAAGIAATEQAGAEALQEKRKLERTA